MRRSLDLGVEAKLLEDVAHDLREGGDISLQIGRNVVLVAKQFRQVQSRRVVELEFGNPQEERLGVDAKALSCGFLLENSLLGGGEHAVQAA